MERQLSNIEQELEAQAQATRPEDAMESGEFGAWLAEASKGRNGRTAAESAPMETSVPARVEGPAGSLGAPTSRVRNILAAIDHADHPAVKVAVDLARPLGAKVAVMFVVDPSLGLTPDAGYAYLTTREEQLVGGEQILHEIERTVPAQSGTFTCLREGKPAEEILAFAKDFHADLIVIGTHRGGLLRNIFIGSVSQAILQRAACPVLLVMDTAAKATATNGAIETPEPS
jgi:nucleotide-binding universal stress UspA family protein